MHLLQALANNHQITQHLGMMIKAQMLKVVTIPQTIQANPIHKNYQLLTLVLLVKNQPNKANLKLSTKTKSNNLDHNHNLLKHNLNKLSNCHQQFKPSKI